MDMICQSQLLTVLITLFLNRLHGLLIIELCFL